jgi:glycosyltransferase involved in cell wall biosynthesis
MTLRIGVDAACWLNRRGFGRYTRELMHAILAADQNNEYVLFMDAATSTAAEALPDERRARRVVVETGAAATRAAAASGSRSPRDLWKMRQAVAAYDEPLDVFFFPADYTYFPVSTSARVVVTKHDMTDRRVPELLFPNWRSRLLWEAKIRLAMRRADLVFTVSETSRRDIVAAFRLPAQRVRVISDAVDPSFSPAPPGAAREDVLARYGIAANESFVLYVGGISPHKNLATLVEAFARWRTQHGARPVSLVLVGDYVADVFHSSYPGIRDLVARSGLESSVRFTGFVPDADLRYFYSAADALVLPSLYEGFGLPVLEAMACGAPVIASRGGALPEVVGEAGLLFDALAVDQLAAALARVLGDARLRSQLIERGHTRAAQFSWDASARAAIAAFEELAR